VWVESARQTIKRKRDRERERQRKRERQREREQLPKLKESKRQTKRKIEILKE